MISKSKLLLIAVFCSWVTECTFENVYDSPIPESEQVIIRRILNVNGYDLSDKELVDPYIGKVTDFHSGVWYGQYSLMIPNVGFNKMVLTNDINKVGKMHFSGGVFPLAGATVDTIVIIADDSIIFIPGHISITHTFKNIPQNINRIRTPRLYLRSNQLTTLPEEIMELTTPPFPYDTFYINLEGNSIDTTTISDTLDKWLQRYFSPYWKNTQVYE